MMPDPKDALTIDDFFASLVEDDKPMVKETYPGSRHERRKPLPIPVPDTVEWDSNAYVKIIKGKRTEMFTIGALAKALHRTPNTVRSWIRHGYVPQAPYRLPSYELEGRMMPGRRLYTRKMIESARMLFAERGLLISQRVEWKKHPDLPIAIQESWAAIYEEMSDRSTDEE